MDRLIQKQQYMFLRTLCELYNGEHFGAVDKVVGF